MANITDTDVGNKKVSGVTFENLFLNMNWFSKLLIAAFIAFQGWMAIELYQLHAEVAANTVSLKFLHESINQLHVDVQQLHSQSADIDRKMNKVLLLLGESAQPDNN